MDGSAVAAARRALLEHFRWQDGHADMWRVFRDPAALAAVVGGLAAPFRDRGVTAVLGVESRGFLLGAAVAVELGAGFVAVRKPGALFPGPKLTAATGPDYRGNRHELLLRRDSLGPDDIAVLVDDWAETGSQALAVRDLARALGANLVGLSLMVDQLSDATRQLLPPVSALVQAAELPLTQ
ncbi:adenine phosphoribosyltransferase [Hamadaea flava]|uniref:Phosphoribosyltransferase n=1 Tax=Hamadaea flava TaxID=1742688 RepID=A0ABV8LXZ4_9ACTN|nr:phosphoribosyltransferase [Hamadaea flava]MCP2329320.1 adenine phosphoribosyltransferase [Hamadaea flava]